MKSRSLIAVGCAIVMATIITVAGNGCAQGSSAPEFGSVRFAPSFDEGMKTAASKNAPVFLLFQEVPG